MIEDDIYRTSSQYRLWSFTSASLTSLRASTNSLASDRVKAAIRRAQDQKTSISRGDAAPNGGVDENGVHNKEKSIDCLTVEEEGKLLRYYCEATLQTAENYRPRKLATNVWVGYILTLPNLKPAHKYTDPPQRRQRSNSSAASTSPTHP